MYYLMDDDMKDLRKLLADLLTKGEWRYSSFEIDTQDLTGHEFKQRIKTLQEKINEHH